MIIVARPPNFDQVLAAFPNADKPGVIFAYDGNVYAPSGADIPPALIAHEEVHLRRQKFTGPDVWWNLYLYDPDFRYYEELLSHAAEFKTLKLGNDRNAGAALLMRTAMRLVAPLYNYVPPRTLQQAIKDLRSHVDGDEKHG